jgi:hypothetical protein
MIQEAKSRVHGDDERARRLVLEKIAGIESVEAAKSG